MTAGAASEGPELNDEGRLRRLGYAQELARDLGGFSNLALSMSIICILAGGVTSFHLGYCSVGGAAIGVGWPLVCLFSLAVAATMEQVASAYPTAGGLYHWSSILGGRGWGWVTAWFNLAGLVTVLAAINVGTYRFVLGSLGPELGWRVDPAEAAWWQALGVVLITGTQAVINDRGIRLTSRLTDFSGYAILVVSALLALALLAYSSSLDPSRLVRWSNYSGPAGGGVWPRTDSLLWLFALGALLPAYTITGFDASAHAAEETRQAGWNVPRGIVRSVLISGLAGWMLLSAVVLAIPDPDEAAAHGETVFPWVLQNGLPRSLGVPLNLGIAVVQYLCGLAALTSSSRMAFAFARDGGLPFSTRLRRVDPSRRTPGRAIWATAAASVLFTVYSPVYSTITAVCTILLYLSYVLPTALGFVAYGRTWTVMGPWSIGRAYRPLGAVSVAGCVALIAIGMQPPNELAVRVVGVFCGVLALGWLVWGHRHFPGPPQALYAERDDG
jgi:amino acid transporter